VPREPLSVRTRRRATRAAVAVVLLVGVFIAYLAITRHPSVVIRPTVCVADSPGGAGWPLEIGQAEIAATIAGVADRRAMPTRALAIAYAAAIQESNLADLHYGDLDSVGVFQQRPSQGWGTPRQIEDPVYASNRFFAALAAVPGYLHMPIYQAAQAVQRSADGQAYAQWATAGSQLALGFGGQRPHAVWCSYGSIGRTTRLASAAAALRGSFGPLTIRISADPHGRAHGGRSGRGGGRGGRAQVGATQVGSARQGWAVAAWLVCHARSYGIRDVQYRGYEWLSYTGTGRWVQHPRAARAPAATTVVFG
jgi:hypothetical protein